MCLTGVSDSEMGKEGVNDNVNGNDEEDDDIEKTVVIGNDDDDDDNERAVCWVWLVRFCGVTCDVQKTTGTVMTWQNVRDGRS
jgi:hypothetical protein